jgi:hypothetical protein
MSTAAVLVDASVLYDRASLVGKKIKQTQPGLSDSGQEKMAIFCEHCREIFRSIKMNLCLSKYQLLKTDSVLMSSSYKQRRMDKREGANAAFRNSVMATAGVNKWSALRLSLTV